MKNLSFNSEHMFIPALVVSAIAHVVLITANGWLPGSTDFSVRNAPNSLAFTVVSQPTVSVIEEEIVTEEIIDQEIAENIVFKNPIKKYGQKVQQQSTESSKEALGAVTKAKPMMRANPAPPYPKLARQRGWEGTVRLSVLVEKKMERSKIL